MKYTMMELLPVVTYLTEKYTSKESTSVTYEKAEQLMGAAIYCIKEYDISSERQYEVDLPQSNGTKNILDIYQKGYDLVVEKTKRTNALYEEIIRNFCAYGNRAYHETVIEGIPQFFIHYDARFCPQNHLLTLDYPVLQSMEALCGINAIEQYLSCIHLEQIFLSACSREYVEDVLRKYHYDYPELFINISSIIMRDMLKRMLEGVDLHKNIEEQLFGLLQMIIEQRYDGNKQLLDYLSGDIKDFIAIINSFDNDSNLC